MARVIVSGEKGKKFTKEGSVVQATVGVVSGKEYYELRIEADDGEQGLPGFIVVTKTSSKDIEPKEVYRVPSKNLRKKAPQKPPSAPVGIPDDAA